MNTTITMQPELSPSMASAIIGANEDLLTDILFWVPVKSVCRFKLVSKYWKSFISSPQFCQRISRKTCKKVTRLFVLRQDNKSLVSNYGIFPLYELGRGSGASFSKPLDYVDDGVPEILESCNGLLCFRTYQKERSWRFGKFIYYICNPTIRQFRKLPEPIHGGIDIITRVESEYSLFEFESRELALAVNLAFDPRKSPHFKVLCVYFSRFGSFHSHEMEIYSSETGQWKCGASFTAETSFRSAVYWNGAINWPNLFRGDGLYFNVDEERFGKWPMPPIQDGPKERVTMYFGESYDHLFLIEYDGYSLKNYSPLCCMKSYFLSSLKFELLSGLKLSSFPIFASLQKLQGNWCQLEK